MPPASDPFYIVRQDIQDTVNELQQRVTKLHGTSASAAEKKSVAKDVEHGCESIRWQLAELEKAVTKAIENPQRFNLSKEELDSRRQWIKNTYRQVDDMSSAAKTALSSSPLPPHTSKVTAQNDAFMKGEYDKQQLLLRQQDENLDHIEQAVTRLGVVGLTIHQELNQQSAMLEDLDEDLDTTHTRLKAAQKKISDVLKKSGTTSQLMLIGVLIVVLIITAVFAFY